MTNAQTSFDSGRAVVISVRADDPTPLLWLLLVSMKKSRCILFAEYPTNVHDTNFKLRALSYFLITLLYVYIKNNDAKYSKPDLIYY